MAENEKAKRIDLSKVTIRDNGEVVLTDPEVLQLLQQASDSQEEEGGHGIGVGIIVEL